MNRLFYGRPDSAARKKKPSPPTTKLNRYGLLRLLSFARPHWWKLTIIMVLTSITSSLTLLYPALTGQIIDIVTISKNAMALHNLIFFLLALVVVQAILGFWQTFWLTAIGEKVVIDLRIKLYSHLQQLPLSFFQDNRTGELLSRLTNDVTLVRAAATTNLMSFVQNMVTLLFGFAIIITGPDALLAKASQFSAAIPAPHGPSSTGSTALWLLMLMPLFILPYLIASRFFRRIYKKELGILSEATAASEETLSNAKIVKAFTREDYEVERYTAIASQQYKISRERARLSGLVSAISTLLGLGGLTAFLWFAGTAVLNGSLTIGNLTTTVIYIFFLARPLTSASDLYSQFQMSLGAAERIFDLLDQPVTLADIPNALPLPHVVGLLRFEHVTFSYDGERLILDDLSFEAEAGRVLALVGPSGAGKTTIANLIPRFFDIKSGKITLDGYDISQIQLKSLREQIGIVLQEPVLFGTTVRENIAYGRLDATQAEIEIVARAANAHEFIDRLPQGYDTLVGERGVKLSVGQRQRIAIARALLRNPRILILDEATSSLDNESESIVQEALERLMQGRTTVVIAHRLSTIQNADRIIVMNQGQVIEQGKHADLLAQNGAYYRLFTRNFQPEAVS